MKRVYELFRALGMPEGVSFEVFGRIMGVRGGEGEGPGKGKNERMRIPLTSKSRPREQQQGGGGWNPALTFLSTHLVGRQEARKARGVSLGGLLCLPIHLHTYSLLYYPHARPEQEPNSRIPQPNTPWRRESERPRCSLVCIHPINCQISWWTLWRSRPGRGR